LGMYFLVSLSHCQVTLVTLNEDLGTSSLTTVEFARPPGQSMYEVVVDVILVPHITWNTFKNPYDAFWFGVYIVWIAFAC
jgi:hypothetical protein